jgi:hypothetical protein
MEYPGKHALPRHLNLEAVLVALEYAVTEEEVMACVATFLASATAFPPDADSFAVLTALFGSECVTAVTEVGAAAVVELEAEAAATGGVLSARAASRLARGLVHRVIQRASRTMARPLQAYRALRVGVRVLRAPRARRTPRRAVRLSAVASAGSGSDGPSPEPSGAPARSHLPGGKPRWSVVCGVQACDASAGRRSPTLAWLDEALPRPETRR